MENLMQLIRRVSGALAIVALTCASAGAQGFDTSKIRVGQTVLVRDLTGAEIKGIVQSSDISKLVVKYGVGRLQDPSDPSRTLDDTRTFTPADVDRVRRPGPIWDGAVKGALVALVPVALFAAAECSGCELGSAYATITAIGAGIGLGIDAAWGPKTVYRNRGESRKVTLAPILGSKGRRGVAASIRF
jgi:hypothetical protein